MVKNIRVISRRRFIFVRAIRFSFVGLLVTAVHAVIAIIFIQLLLINPPLANGVAFIGATLLSYIINTVWSFSSKLHGKTLSRFAVVSIIGFLSAMLVSWIAQVSGYNYLQGICAVAIMIPPLTFLLHNFWTYK